MSITLKVLESNNFLVKEINKAIAAQLNDRISKNKNKAIKQLRNIIPSWISSSPEIQSLNEEGVQFSLNAQFGLPDGQAAAATSAIIASVADSIQVNFRKVPDNLRVTLEFAIQPVSFTNLLSIPEGTVITQTNGTPLPWMDWLLNLGSTIIVAGYTYVPELEGRSGGGTMNAGFGWRVPPQFAGTPDDNFITRALANRDSQLAPILQGLIT